MNSDAHINNLIDNLREEYSPEAVAALQSFGTRAIQPLLNALWQPDVDPYGHDTFAEILVHILRCSRPQQAIHILVSLLEHENADVRRRAVQAMGDTRDYRAQHLLRIALYDRNDLVQQAAAQALVRLQYGTDRLHACTAALYDREPRVRYYAVRQLEEIHANNALIEATYNEDPAVRQIAVWSLGKAKVHRAMPALIDALQDHELEVRAGAAWALGRLADAEAIPALLPLLNDPEPTVVQLTSAALLKLGYAPTA
ncbi:MAG TPA: HEAT repeat domain-containing protein [Spirillospora sp.]|nr:HEAT repeat domain-containing protein [Spirillospora sp.]